MMNDEKTESSISSLSAEDFEFVVLSSGDTIESSPSSSSSSSNGSWTNVSPQPPAPPPTAALENINGWACLSPSSSSRNEVNNEQEQQFLVPMVQNIHLSSPSCAASDSDSDDNSSSFSNNSTSSNGSNGFSMNRALGQLTIGGNDAIPKQQNKIDYSSLHTSDSSEASTTAKRQLPDRAKDENDIGKEGKLCFPSYYHNPDCPDAHNDKENDLDNSTDDDDNHDDDTVVPKKKKTRVLPPHEDILDTWCNYEQPKTSGALVRLYQDPSDLVHNPFEAARARAENENKLIIVNIQCYSNFASHVMNRDIWSNSWIRDLVQSNFVYWQATLQERDGASYVRQYNVTAYPHVSIMDPKTRRIFWRHDNWTGPRRDFGVVLTDFAFYYEEQETKKTAITEENAALKASEDDICNETKETGSATPSALPSNAEEVAMVVDVATDDTKASKYVDTLPALEPFSVPAIDVNQEYELQLKLMQATPYEYSEEDDLKDLYDLQMALLQSAQQQ